LLGISLLLGLRVRLLVLLLVSGRGEAVVEGLSLASFVVK